MIPVNDRIHGCWPLGHLSERPIIEAYEIHTISEAPGHDSVQLVHITSNNYGLWYL